MQYLFSLSEELLLVKWYLVYEKTVEFRVYRLDLSGPRWERMTSLGDQMMFLGVNSWLALSASHFPICRGGMATDLGRAQSVLTIFTTMDKCYELMMGRNRMAAIALHVFLYLLSFGFFNGVFGYFLVQGRFEYRVFLVVMVIEMVQFVGFLHRC